MRVTPVEPSDPRVGEFARLTDVQWRRQQEPKWGCSWLRGEGDPPGPGRRLPAPGGAAARASCPESRNCSPQTMSTYWSPTNRCCGRSSDSGCIAARWRRSSASRRRNRPTSSSAHGDCSCLKTWWITNVGLVFRSAAALGIDAVLVSPGCADPYYRRSLKTSMGAVLALPWTVAEPWPDVLGWLRAQGWLLAALTPDPQALPVADGVAEAARSLAAGVALLLGSEGPGLTPRARAEVQQQWRIPMTDRVDSLNVAAAAASPAMNWRRRRGSS